MVITRNVIRKIITKTCFGGKATTHLLENAEIDAMSTNSRFAALALLCVSAALAAPTRISCIGDSITVGGTGDCASRDSANYPAFLQEFLGTHNSSIVQTCC
jgi:hypothetical protein